VSHSRIAALTILLTVLAGCSSQSSPPAAATPAQTTTAPATAPPAAAPAPAPAAAPASSAALKTGDTNISGVVAEVTECARKDGVLSVRVRLHNTSSQKAEFHLIDNVNGVNHEKYYLSAASKKYFILKDTEGAYLTPQASNFGTLNASIDPGGQYTWWAKYPAPPAEVKAVTLYMPFAPPLEDIAVSDR
jgi:hypothetical protein